MDFTVEDCISSILLRRLEQDDLSLVHTSQGWTTVPTSSLLIDGALTKINERLTAIEKLLQGGESDGTAESTATQVL